MTATPQPDTPEGRAGGVLMIRFGASEAVLALPVLHALREADAAGEIGWLVDSETAPLLEGHPEVSRIHVLPGADREEGGWFRRRAERRALADELRACGYGAVIDIESTPASSRMAKASGARLRIGFAPPEGRRPFRLHHTHGIAPGPLAVHEIDRDLSLLRPLGVAAGGTPDGCVFPDFFGDEDIRRLGQEPYVLVHLGSENPIGRWPLERFFELTPMLCELARARAVVAASTPEELSRAEAVAREVGGTASACHAANAREMAALSTGAALFVGSEHPAFHLAWTSGVPTVGIFGPTSVAARGPMAKRARAVAAGLGCIGCGRVRCPDGTAACMRAVTVESVFEAAKEVLSL